MKNPRLQQLADIFGDLLMEDDLTALDIYDAIMDELRELHAYHVEGKDKCEVLLDLFDKPEPVRTPRSSRAFKKLVSTDGNKEFKLTSKYMNLRNLDNKMKDDEDYFNDVWKNK